MYFFSAGKLEEGLYNSVVLLTHLCLKMPVQFGDNIFPKKRIIENIQIRNINDDSNDNTPFFFSFCDQWFLLKFLCIIINSKGIFQ